MCLVVLSCLVLFVFAVVWLLFFDCRCLDGSHDDLVVAKAKEEDHAPKVRRLRLASYGY